MTVSNTPHPAILQTCKEPLQEALKHYTLDFSTTIEYRHPRCSIVTPPESYINGQAGTACLVNADDLERRALMALSAKTEFRCLICNAHGEWMPFLFLYLLKPGVMFKLKDLIIFDFDFKGLWTKEHRQKLKFRFPGLNPFEALSYPGLAGANF